MKTSTNDRSRSDARACYASFWGKLLRKWDWWIYCRAVHTFRRMAIDNPGWSYFMELNLRGWNAQNPIDPALKSATERFHDALHDPLRDAQYNAPWHND